MFIPALVSFLLDYPGNYLTSFTNKGLLLFVLFISFVLPNLNHTLLLKYYRIFVYLALGLYCIQEVTYILLGFRLTLYLPFFEMYYEGTDVSDLVSSRASMERSSSFFLEPAHFLQYIFPYVCIVTFNTLSNFKDNWKECLFLVFVVLFARSGCGYVGLIFMAIYFVVISDYMSFSKKISLGLVIVFLLYLVIHFFSQTDLVSNVIKRFNQEFALNIDISSGRSGFIRMYRGYFIFSLLDSWSKVFGVGTGSTDYVCSLYKHPLISYDGPYLNGIQTVLIQGGFLGTFLVIRFFKKFCANWHAISLSILVVFLGMCFVESMWFNAKMLLYISVAYSYNIVHRTN